LGLAADFCFTAFFAAGLAAFRWGAAFAVISCGGLILLLYVPFLLGNHYIVDFNILALLVIPYPLLYAFMILRERIVDLVVVPLLIAIGVALTSIGIFDVLSGYLHAAVPQWPVQLDDGLTLAAMLATMPFLIRFWQRNINWLLYGDRDDPTTIMGQLGQRLELIAAPTAIFPVLVETTAQVLRLPFVALQLKKDEQIVRLAVYGKESREVRTIELRHHNEIIGQLVLARPRFGGRLSLVEQRLVEGLVQQAAHVIYATQVTEDLQRAREHLVTVREVERRRLRNDLHDGLGASLVACRMMNHSVRELFARDLPAAERILAAQGQALEETSANVRLLIDNLRPPKLDDLGLVGAIRAQADQYMQQDETGRLAIRVSAPEDLGPLPVAVEVALYRIAQEALTNVVRHAHAAHCDIILSRGERLGIEVRDDGIGFAPLVRAGVGMRSMRERSEELGGIFSLEALTAHSGTRVSATFPLAQEEPA